MLSRPHHRPPLDYTALGHEIARQRKAQSMTLENLAENAGVSRQTILNVENHHKPASLETIASIAWALDIPLLALMGHLTSESPKAEPSSDS